MIVRIVKMHFHLENIPAFLELFEERKSLIRHFEGCLHLELWQEENNPQVFFTYSHWESEEHLNHYRFSELFKDTWRRTKALFAESPNAWSVKRKMIVA